MLTRREVEGQLRSLSFRASVRARRAARDRAQRFAGVVAGVLVGVGLLALLGAVSLVRTGPADLASWRSSAQANEWVSNSPSSSTRRSSSLFFTARRTWHPNDPRSRNRHHSGDG